MLRSLSDLDAHSGLGGAGDPDTRRERVLAGMKLVEEHERALLGSVLDAHHAIAHVKRWMKPSPRSTSEASHGSPRS